MSDRLFREAHSRGIPVGDLIDEEQRLLVYRRKVGAAVAAARRSDPVTYASSMAAFLADLSDVREAHRLLTEVLNAADAEARRLDDQRRKKETRSD
jgi:hypothetical protein